MNDIARKFNVESRDFEVLESVGTNAIAPHPLQI